MECEAKSKRKAEDEDEFQLSDGKMVRIGLLLYSEYGFNPCRSLRSSWYTYKDRNLYGQGNLSSCQRRYPHIRLY